MDNNELLQAIGHMIDEKLDKKLKAELQPINERLDNMQADIKQIRRDTSITRVAVNSLIEWVDEAREVTGISHPNK